MIVALDDDVRCSVGIFGGLMVVGVSVAVGESVVVGVSVNVGSVSVCVVAVTVVMEGVVCIVCVDVVTVLGCCSGIGGGVLDGW